ncbi:hypothetical protein [Roseovarius sp. M141]|uniref:hypothetical protein n=1 Tax=Roseovarius sp. M141 TaxID=2583806 RepID=UPI0020CF3521|nr:hypothetical protein [Roseovarius sp. M141]MCQ0091216.1 hypothetical protein [Roseovarius sp. M141]
MFDKDSRYAKLPLREFIDPAGRSVAYVARRIIRSPEAPVASIKVQSGDRLDLIADRAYGEPRQFWRVADANPNADHTTLTEPPGRRLALNQIKPE